MEKLVVYPVFLTDFFSVALKAQDRKRAAYNSWLEVGIMIRGRRRSID